MREASPLPDTNMSAATAPPGLFGAAGSRRPPGANVWLWNVTRRRGWAAIFSMMSSSEINFGSVMVSPVWWLVRVAATGYHAGGGLP